MPEQNCPNCGKPYQAGEEVCLKCGFVFPFSTTILNSGTILQDRYEILELVHTGGNGYVYLAKDKRLYDRLCIVKQVREKVQSDEHRGKLEEEALRMAKLSHPNIANIYDHFVEGGFYFLIVERINGHTLNEIYKERQGQLSEIEVVKWAISICDVINYIHREGIIHRDISPDNIMLTEDGTIKFIDFGTLREFRIAAAGKTAGTGKFGYAPPEQWHGKPEQRSDIFALGATIYNLLTGFLPLTKTYQTSSSPQKEDFNPSFPPIRTKNPGVSIQLETILHKALQLDINSRFASALEMQQALKSLDKEATQPGNQVTKKRRFFKSWKRLIFISIPIICLIGVGLYFLLRNQEATYKFPAHVPQIIGSNTITNIPSTNTTSSQPILESQFATIPPNIDGILENGEWPDNNSSVQFKYTLDGVQKTGGITAVYCMNDSNNLYLALSISTPDFREGLLEKNGVVFQVYFIYDGDGDGFIKPGDRFRGFESLVWVNKKRIINKPQFKAFSLSDGGYYLEPYIGTGIFGKGAAGYSAASNSYVYECKIPINTEDAKDLAAKPGDTVKMNILVNQHFPYGTDYTLNSASGWPGRVGLIDIDNYGKIVLASSPNEPRLTTETTETPNLKWHYDIGDIQICSPAIGADGTIYTGSGIITENHLYLYYLYAFNPDGSLKWKQQAGNTLEDPVIAPDGTVYVGSYFALIAFDPYGNQKWAYSTDYFVTTPFVGPDGTVYISQKSSQDSSCKLDAINPDGSLRWKYNIDKPGVTAPAVSTDGTIYVSSWGQNETNGELLAINPDQTIKWRYKYNFGYCKSPCVGTDGTIYLGHNSGILAVRADGSLKWSCDVIGISSPLEITADGTVHVILKNQGNEILCAVYPGGSIGWERTIGSVDPSTAYLVDSSSPKTGPDGTVYVGSQEENLLAFSPDGLLKWNISTQIIPGVPSYGNDPNSPAIFTPSSPAISKDGTIYIGSSKRLNAIGVTISQ
jgi:serine/threonine protein kinase